MNKRINNKTLIESMNKKDINVVSIDTENMIYVCDDGNEYPLMDGLETLSIEELQNHINKAKQTTINILKQIEEENG